MAKKNKKRVQVHIKEKKRMGGFEIAGIATVLGLFSGAYILLGNSITGNVIGTSPTNVTAAVLILIGVIGGFFYLRMKNSNKKQLKPVKKKRR